MSPDRRARARRAPWWRGRLPACWSLLLALGGCAALPRQQAPEALSFEALSALGGALGSGLERALAGHLQGAQVEPLLVFAPFLDTAQFRNAYGIRHPATGLQASRQEFFLLADGGSALDSGRSVLRAYETIVAAARCAPGAAAQPGCLLLEAARTALQAPKEPASLFRLGWPDWRPVGASPDNWADDEAPWLPLRLDLPPYVIEAEYLYVRLQRGWLSVELLASGGWYAVGECRGFVSGGGADGGSPELLPRLPVGLLLTRQLTVHEGRRLMLQREPVYVHGWVHQRLPLSPRLSDPCRADCPGFDSGSPPCRAAR